MDKSPQGEESGQEVEKKLGTSIITRVEMSCHNPLRGGTPSDNNAVEGENRHDKVNLSYQKDLVSLFLPSFRKLLEGHSWTDLSFGLIMKDAVHSWFFYGSVETIRERHHNTLPTILSLQFPFSSVKHDVPKGSMIVAGEHCITKIGEAMLADGDGDEIQEYRHFLMSNLWVEQYKTIVQNPVNECHKMPFQDIVEDVIWDFHLLRDIEVEDEMG
jgi:hypothetical protein